ncbi:hypothetical protein FUAX_53560 (plasmid) [Fulvitalea axinellae]|uniref:Uncharacterized protein n=1 Tax=Fulvitalea axinellae TaxID=1182444 RepID=A0AAU9D2W5_9BACT|nr:hypothetical protein FUAX_53560 [Fulvitalea axinellae]
MPNMPDFLFNKDYPRKEQKKGKKREERSLYSRLGAGGRGCLLTCV